LYDSIGIPQPGRDAALPARAGPTYDSGSNYALAAFRFADNGSATAGSAPSSPATEIALDGGSTIGTNANYGVNGTLRLFSPQSSIYKRIQSELSYLDAQGTPHLIYAASHGVYLSATVLTAVRFLFSTGNIASGIIRCYGVAKS